MTTAASVGNGTTDPQLNLDVKGEVRFTNLGDGAILLNLSTERHWEFRQLKSGASTALELASIGGGGNKDFIITTTGQVGIGTEDPRWTLDVNGSIGSSSTQYHSDIRWKKNIETISGALDTISQLRGVNFDWRRDEFRQMNFDPGKHLGLVAQEVEEVIPEVVSTDAKGFKAIEYQTLVPELIEAVKQLNAENEALAQRMLVLESARDEIAVLR